MNSTRNFRWLEDINFLSSQLPRKHRNLFFQKNKEDFLKELELVKMKIDILTDHEIKLEIAKIISSIKDAHTSVPLQVNLLLPLELYWFSDGIYVIAAPLEYKDILFCKITRINELEVDSFIAILSSIISYENETYLKSQLPKYFPAIELLYDLKLVNDIHCLELTYEHSRSELRTMQIKSLPIKKSREALSLISNDLIDNNLPLCRRDAHKNYWYKYIDTSKIVYFKYNSCRDMLEKDVFTFCKELIDFIENHTVDKLIIDLRNNFGGNSSLLDPFIQDIKNCGKINNKGGIFVIIGRETFSSALLNALSLKENTCAIFLGEPTGGKPNCYGEVERFTLKNFGLIVCYSTKYYKTIENDEIPSLLPDINIPVTIDNYVNNEDPCFEYVINC